MVTLCQCALSPELPTVPDAFHASTMAWPVSVSPVMSVSMMRVTTVFTIAALLFSGVPLAGMRWPHVTVGFVLYLRVSELLQ